MSLAKYIRKCKDPISLTCSDPLLNEVLAIARDDYQIDHQVNRERVLETIVGELGGQFIARESKGDKVKWAKKKNFRLQIGMWPVVNRYISSAWRNEIADGESRTHELGNEISDLLFDGEVDGFYVAEGVCQNGHYKKVNEGLGRDYARILMDPDAILAWRAMGVCHCGQIVYPKKSIVMIKPDRTRKIRSKLAQHVIYMTERTKGEPSQVDKAARLGLGDRDYFLDIRGIRFVCFDENSCYVVLNQVIEPLVRRGILTLAPIGEDTIEDYIRNPRIRENGRYFGTIHVNCIYEGLPIELQIRSREAHQGLEVGSLDSGDSEGVSHDDYKIERYQRLITQFGQDWPRERELMAEILGINIRDQLNVLVR